MPEPDDDAAREEDEPHRDEGNHHGARERDQLVVREPLGDACKKVAGQRQKRDEPGNQLRRRLVVPAL